MRARLDAGLLDARLAAADSETWSKLQGPGASSLPAEIPRRSRASK